MVPDRFRLRLPQPVEPWAFWNHYLSRFQWPRRVDTPPRRRTAADISEEEVSTTRDAVSGLLAAAGKRRLLSKYTDFPRMTYMAEVFPDARFIHIVRDGRAVAASYLGKLESGTFGTWEEREWWMQGWPDSWRSQWREQHASRLGFVAYQWKFFVSMIRQESQKLRPGQYAEFTYRDIVKSPSVTLEKIFAFCELAPSQTVDWYVREIHLENMNKKWPVKFSEEEARQLEEIISEPELKALLEE